MVSVRIPHGKSPASEGGQLNHLLREHRRLLELLARGEPMICADVTEDPRWREDWKELCLSPEIRAGYSSPIVEAESMPLGGVFLCLQEPKEPTERELTLSDMVTGVATIVLSREKSDKALAAAAS